MHYEMTLMSCIVCPTSSVLCLVNKSRDLTQE